ncbi:hypothetical protein T265_15614, partial [Opisthorchis viverrini]
MFHSSALGGVDGTLIFGEYSKKQIPGRVYHVPLVPSSPPVKHWIVQVESITCEDGTVLLENFSALLDTGSTKSYLPPPFVNRLFSGDWAMPNESGDISCDAMLEMPELKVKLPELHLSWGAMQYIIQ